MAMIVAFGKPACAAGSPPRLLEVIGKNEQGATGKFYILPVTHNGLAAEHDDYFYKTVVPIAMRADVFLSEKSLMFAHEAPPCPTPPDDSRKNQKILAQAPAAVEKAAYDYTGPVPEPDGISEQDRLEIREAMHVMARMGAERLSEYGLLLQMHTYLVSTQIHYPERLITVGTKRKSTDMPCFKWINTLIGNLKTATNGTYHAFDFEKYGALYLAEAQYSFNCRFDLSAILQALLGDAIRTAKRTEVSLRQAEGRR